MFYKSARVEYHPLGVVGAIVPWNYPFHNVFNPMTAALFAGNALVIKVSLASSLSDQKHMLRWLPVSINEQGDSLHNENFSPARQVTRS